MIKTNIRLINIAEMVLPKIDFFKVYQMVRPSVRIGPISLYRIEDIGIKVNNLVKENMNSQWAEMRKMIKGEGK